LAQNRRLLTYSLEMT